VASIAACSPAIRAILVTHDRGVLLRRHIAADYLSDRPRKPIVIKLVPVKAFVESQSRYGT
jgi:hypothetical protein